MSHKSTEIFDVVLKACQLSNFYSNRRKSSLLLSLAALVIPTHVQAEAQTANPSVQAESRALREMRIHKVPELGLVIWTENQPTWEATLSQINGRPSFIVQSPDNNHPPAVMTYGSWPQERVPADQFDTMAQVAIQRASQNFGFNIAQARNIKTKPLTYGTLQGVEGNFVGRVEGVEMDVKVFVGQQAGQFPVALSIYTLKGKMPHLVEVVRRAWTKLSYQ